MDISYANTNQDLIPIEEESKEDSTELLIPNTSSNVTIIEASNTVITHEPQVRIYPYSFQVILVAMSI